MAITWNANRIASPTLTLSTPQPAVAEIADTVTLQPVLHMSSSPLRRHSLAIGTDGTPSKRPHQLGTPSSPTQGTRSVSSSSALPVLSQGRSFSPSVNNAPRSANSVGSPFPTRLVKVPSRDQLGEAPGSPSLDRNRDVVADEGHVQVGEFPQSPRSHIS